MGFSSAGLGSNPSKVVGTPFVSIVFFDGEEHPMKTINHKTAISTFRILWTSLI